MLCFPFSCCFLQLQREVNYLYKNPEDCINVIQEKHNQETEIFRCIQFTYFQKIYLDKELIMFMMINSIENTFQRDSCVKIV